jgi:hypothetical protein
VIVVRGEGKRKEIEQLWNIVIHVVYMAVVTVLCIQMVMNFKWLL